MIELGVYSFGDVQRKNGELGPTSEGIENLLEAIQFADTVGLDFFGVGEHHTEYFPASSPSTILAAAAASTKRIKLSSAVSVISTDDPVRVYQQMATASIISKGRVEIIAGRGSSTESFPLFGYDLKEYDALYAEKLALLLQLNLLDKNEKISWEGEFRAPLKDAVIVPQPERPIKTWLATGGNPQSSIRAGANGLPISYAIIGGSVSRFKPVVDLYRAAGEKYEVPADQLEVSVASPGYIADTNKEAKDEFWKRWGWTMKTLGKVRGFAPPTREHYDAESGWDGAIFAGDPAEIADRIVDLHKKIGHTRHFFQMDVGQLPQEKFLRSIELLATEVKPRVEKLLKEAADES